MPMTSQQANRSFIDTTAQQLNPDAKELWMPMADTYSREGPEAVKAYLDAVRDRLESNVKQLLEEFQGS